MKTTELRKKSMGELEKLVRDWQDEARSLYRERFTTEVQNVRLLRQTRKNIARALTILHETRDVEPEVLQAKKSSEKER